MTGEHALRVMLLRQLCSLLCYSIAMLAVLTGPVVELHPVEWADDVDARASIKYGCALHILLFKVAASS